MKKNTLIFGVVAGLIVSTIMAFTAINYSQQSDFEGGMIVGFASMILAFPLIFVAIKNYRDRFNHGHISFGKAFQIGMLITAIASTMYVVSWLIVYYNFIPDFMEKYTAFELKNIQSEVLNAAEKSKKIADINDMKEMYKNPVAIILFTYLEIFPVGLIITLVCSLILKKNA